MDSKKIANFGHKIGIRLVSASFQIGNNYVKRYVHFCKGRLVVYTVDGCYLLVNEMMSSFTIPD